jgi:hypothetical protein
MYNNSVSVLTTNTFNYCPSFNMISFSQQLFTHIPSGFAQNCGGLMNLYLDQNQISTFHIDAFVGLTNLTTLGLTENKITCIPPGLFAPLKKVSNINLFKNQIIAVDPQTFVGLPNLGSINLSQNSIVNFPKLNLTGTSLPPSSSLSVSFNDNPVNAINPALLAEAYASRPSPAYSTNFNFGEFMGATCAPSLLSVMNDNWVTMNASLSMCFNNWTPEMASNPVPCAATTTTSTTSTTTTSQPPSSVAPPANPCCNKGVLKVILNAFNMTFSIDLELK